MFLKDGQDIQGIYERNDIQIRSKEGLEQYKGYYKIKIYQRRQ